MLHPSYTDLMKVVNKDVEEGETKIVNSRYSIVMATSKRADNCCRRPSACRCERGRETIGRSQSKN